MEIKLTQRLWIILTIIVFTPMILILIYLAILEDLKNGKIKI
jgi:hypothetical protein